MFDYETTAEHEKYLMYIAKTGNIIYCLISKHDPETRGPRDQYTIHRVGGGRSPNGLVKFLEG
jgi:hypothetical protein